MCERVKQMTRCHIKPDALILPAKSNDVRQLVKQAHARLTDDEFEELTYDLLHALGFVNLDWRRWSGKGGATADQGRDVVGH